MEHHRPVCVVAVLAATSFDQKNAQVAFGHPSQELLFRFAGSSDCIHPDIETDVTSLVNFKLVEDSVTKSGAYLVTNNSSEMFWPALKEHLVDVSHRLFTVTLLAEFLGENSVGRLVIHSGGVVQELWINNPNPESALSNIFLPFSMEFEEGLEFGSLWDQWLDDTNHAIQKLHGGVRR